MITYKNRPVFEFVPNWNGPIPSQFNYQLDEHFIGFGAREIEALQSHVAHGFQFEVLLKTAQEIFCYDAFFEALYGPVQGFWLPSVLSTFQITANHDENQFDVVDTGFTDTWASHPAQHLVFESPEGTMFFAEVTAVSDNGDDTERITIDQNFAFDENWTVKRLHYVRQVSGDDRGQFHGEGIMVRSCRVIELPNEYTTAELGKRPVWLYHFWVDNDTTVNWRFTSYYSNLTSGGNVFTAKAINHGGLTKSTRGQSRGTTIEAKYESTNPLSLLYPMKLSRPLNVKIMSATLDALNSTVTWFTGRIIDARIEGIVIDAQAETLPDVLGSQLPAQPHGPGCPWQVYESNTCKANRASFEKSVTIDNINGREITVSDVSLSGIGVDHFAIGWIEVGTGADYEERQIITSTAESGNAIVLTLDAALNYAVPTDAAVIVPGCDGNYSTCDSKFSNTDNHGGDPSMPQRNLALRAIQVETQTGKK